MNLGRVWSHSIHRYLHWTQNDEVFRLECRRAYRVPWQLFRGGEDRGYCKAEAKGINAILTFACSYLRQYGTMKCTVYQNNYSFARFVLSVPKFHGQETSRHGWTIVRLQVLRLRAGKNGSDVQQAKKWYLSSSFFRSERFRVHLPGTRCYFNIILSIGRRALSEWRGNWTVIQNKSITSCIKCTTHLKKTFKIASERIPQSTPMTIQRALSISIASVIWWPNLCKARGNVPYKLLQHHDRNCVVCPVSSVSASFLCPILTV